MSRTESEHECYIKCEFCGKEVCADINGMLPKDWIEVQIAVDIAMDGRILKEPKHVCVDCREKLRLLMNKLAPPPSPGELDWISRRLEAVGQSVVEESHRLEGVLRREEHQQRATHTNLEVAQLEARLAGHKKTISEQEERNSKLQYTVNRLHLEIDTQAITIEKAGEFRAANEGKTDSQAETTEKLVQMVESQAEVLRTYQGLSGKKQDKIERQREAISGLQQKLESTVENTVLAEEYNRVCESNTALKLDKESLLRTIHLLQCRIEEYKPNEQLQEDKTELTRRLDFSNNQCGNWERSYNTLGETNKNLQEERDRLLKTMQQLTGWKSECAYMKEERDKLKKEFDSLKKLYNQVWEDYRQAKRVNAKISDALCENQEELSKARKNLDICRESNREMNKKVVRQSSMLEGYKDTIEALRKKLATTQGIVDNLTKEEGSEA